MITWHVDDGYHVANFKADFISSLEQVKSALVSTHSLHPCTSYMFYLVCFTN